MREGLPYSIVGGTKFYDRKEIKNVLAYLILICNLNDNVALKRIINFPVRGIGEKTIKLLNDLANKKKISLFESLQFAKELKLRNKQCDSISNFYDSINKFHDLLEKLDCKELFRVILEEFNIEYYYKNNPVEQDRYNNIQELKSSIDYFAETSGGGLREFLQEIALYTDLDDWNSKQNSITLMTVHAAKGLEFPTVFITGLEQGLFPLMRIDDSSDQFEEERRLFYVGMTRAKEKLYLMRSFRRGCRGGSGPSAPSRFLSEIPDELIMLPGKEPPSPKTQEKSPSKNNNHKASHRVITSKTLKEKPFTGNQKPKVRTRRVVNKIDPSNIGPVFKTGDKVKHHSFGDGIVLNTESTANDVQITVAFKEGTGVKKLLASFAKLEKTDP